MSPSSRHPVDITGGNSHIVDYRGNVVSYSASAANTMTSAIIDIEALRQFRAMNLNSNWLKDMRIEPFKRTDEKPIHPSDLWLNNDPKGHAEVDQVYRGNIKRLKERGAWTKPADDFPGARYRPPSPAPAAEEWLIIKQLWEPWNEDETEL